jgi:hypothetical protein
LREILPARLLVVCAAGDTGPDMAALKARHLKCCVYKATEGNNVLLKQLNDGDELH